MFIMPERNQKLGDHNGGLFEFIPKVDGPVFTVIASNDMGWEHVSVSLNMPRCPTWNEMCIIKDEFWEAEDMAIQYHPKKSEYVNNHPFVLHMWRPIGSYIPTPPIKMI